MGDIGTEITSAGEIGEVDLVKLWQKVLLSMVALASFVYSCSDIV